MLFAGKFQARKRPIDAVQAVARLGAAALLVMAGDGPLAGEARTEASRLGIRLAWKGFINQSQLPAAFALADAVLVPSAWESWGLIVNEALASGVPCVVTTRVACAPDLIVDAVTGFTCEPSDVDAMAARLDDIRRCKDYLRDGDTYEYEPRGMAPVMGRELETIERECADRELELYADERGLRVVSFEKEPYQ